MEHLRQNRIYQVTHRDYLGFNALLIVFSAKSVSCRNLCLELYWLKRIKESEFIIPWT